MFENKVIEQIDFIYDVLLEDSRLEELRKTDRPYFEKYFLYHGTHGPNVHGGFCDGCNPRLQEDWVGQTEVPGLIGSFYSIAYKDEKVADDNYVCLSRCGNPEVENAKQDGRIDIRFLKPEELWKYVCFRPPELVRLDREQNIENDSKINYSKNNDLLQELFYNILVPSSYKQQPEKNKTVTVAVSDPFPPFCKIDFMVNDGWKKITSNKFQKKESLLDRNVWFFLRSKQRVLISELLDSEILQMEYEIFRPDKEKIKDIKKTADENLPALGSFYNSKTPETQALIKYRRRL